jgi:hypothetical protein
MKHRLRATALAAGLAGGLAMALALPGVAFAHVEVSADHPQAGATNVTVTFEAEAESSEAGIASIRTVLPAGLTPADVSLVKAPAGWQLTANADGYVVAGKARPTGENVTYSIRVASLPNAAELAFKTLVTYANGDVDRWIEIPSAANPDPANPAPVLKLQPAAAAPSPTLASNPASPPAGTTPAATSVMPTPTGAEEGGDNTWRWWLLGALVVLGAVGGVVLWRRARRPSPGDAG